ncbi:MAG: class I SAM-dependent methyltransferase [Gemmatimonadota bacterium]|nr:class I SAM-dependent methyltransferase [Gemmatimonadota bacterium]
MLNRLLRRLEREAFLTSPLGIVVSPVYFIRDGLHRNIRRMAPAITGAVLDFGCGSKPYESLFTRASTYTGVDIQVSGHDHRNSRMDVFYDGHILPFADGTFDSAVSFEVFEHVFNIDELLSEIRRVLKPGGAFLLSVPFAWDEHEAPYDFARYTSFGIRHVLERNGYSVQESVKTTPYVLTLSQVFIAYLSRYVLPQSTFPARVFQLLLIFPLNVLALLVNALFPQTYEYYCNNVVLSRKA